MKTAFLGLKATWESRAIGGRSAPLVPEEKMALKARRVVEVQTATRVLWDPLGRRENSECRDYQVTREDKGPRVLSDFPAFLVPTERRAAGAHLGSQDHGGSEARRVRGANGAPGASLGSPAPRATLEATAPLALRVNGDPTDPKDPPVSLDPRALLALRARTGSRDTLDREERPVSKARPAPQGPRASWALRVPREKRAQWASVATPGPQAPPVSRGSPALPGKKGRRVTRVPPASLGKTAPLDCVVSLGIGGFPVQWAHSD